MGGIIGRLFREFALTVTASIALSALVSLTLAPMLCSRFMHHESGRHGAIYRAIEAGFDAMLSFYRRTLDVVLRHQAITLGVFFATMALTAVMFVQIPKGFFPIQDTGLISGFAEASQDTSPDEMMKILRKMGDVILQDPDVAASAMFTGTTGGAQTANTGRGFIVLKPRDERELTSSQIIDRLRPQLAKIEGATLFMQPAQDITVGGRIARASFQYRNWRMCPPTCCRMRLSSRSRSTATKPRVSAFPPRSSTIPSMTPSDSARSRNISPSSRHIGLFWKFFRSSSETWPRWILSTSSLRSPPEQSRFQRW
jgi:multidrug efflux pump subunit AcrB